MTTNAVRLTDDLLRASLRELAEGRDGGELMADVMRTVDATPQLQRRLWDAPGLGRAGLLVAAALLLTVLIGTAVALSLPRPQPEPTPSADAELPRPVRASAFVVPFTYLVPAGETAELTYEPSYPAVIYTLRHGYSQPTRTRKLEVFLVEGHVHGCPSASEATATLDRDPQTFLEELRDEIGVGIARIRPAMMGNLPGFSADIDPRASTCDLVYLHENGMGLGWASREPRLDRPSRLIVARVGATTIGVRISASTAEELAVWLPTAQAYVDSFVFRTTDD
jgi:hypothetical protein